MRRSEGDMMSLVARAAIAAGLIGAFLGGGCALSPSVAARLSPATEVVVTKYVFTPGAESQRTASISQRNEIDKVIRILGSRRVYYASQGMTEYSLDFRSASGQTLAVVDVMGRGVEWYIEGEADHPYAVTGGLMDYLDGLFAPLGDVK